MLIGTLYSQLFSNIFVYYFIIHNYFFKCFFIGQQCVDLIITDLGVFEVMKGEGLKLIEIAHNVDISQIVSSTGCEFSVADDLKEMGQVTDEDL